jgi:hypothetical protein
LKAISADISEQETVVSSQEFVDTIDSVSNFMVVGCKYTYHIANGLHVLHPLKHSGNYTYHHINIHQFYVLPTHCVFMCFVWISEQTALISIYKIGRAHV